jgi:single-strand DNA-binding protein
MATYNRVIVCGHLGQDAELKYTPGGEAVTTLSVATNEVWTGKDGKKQERVEWNRCVVWGKQAESLAEYLVKGKLVLAEGKLQTRKWTDKNQIERYTTEIRCDRIVLLSGGGGKGGGVPHPATTETTKAQPAQAVTVPDDDDIPF